ncbi:MAG TPA: hypothetical protein VMD49_11090 [Steroidobacteraceae bacterium]|nr:hypothetical protein [Steroidobacteraceae bacterium]
MNTGRFATPGKTRSCPHCKATILDSATVCPGCNHHLRFDSASAQRQPALTPLHVEGTLRHPANGPTWEYSVVLTIRNGRGQEIARQVVGVGALQPTEERAFTLAVEVFKPAEVREPKPEAPAPPRAPDARAPGQPAGQPAQRPSRPHGPLQPPGRPLPAAASGAAALPRAPAAAPASAPGHAAPPLSPASSGKFRPPPPPLPSTVRPLPQSGPPTASRGPGPGSAAGPASESKPQPKRS